jgi:TRAP-type C4-dicarboxylate transport system substrate-binding protein
MRIVVSVLSILVTALVTTPPDVEAQEYRWRGVAANRLIPQFGLYTWLAEELEKRSGGQVKLEMFSFPELGFTGFDLIRVVRAGLVDIGDITPQQVAGDLPVIEAADLPGLYGFEASVKAHVALLPALKRYEDKLGGVVLGGYVWPLNVVFSRKPIKTPADLKGLKIRVFGVGQTELIRALGAEPVAIPFAEVYTALERGTTDAALTSTDSGFRAKLFEVTKHMVDLDLGTAGSALLVVGKRSWDKLTPELRALLTKLGEEFTERGLELARRTNTEGIDKNKQNGLEWVPVSPPMSAAVREAVTKVVVPSWAKRTGADAKPIFNQYIAPHAGFTIP